MKLKVIELDSFSAPKACDRRKNTINGNEYFCLLKNIIRSILNETQGN